MYYPVTPVAKPRMSQRDKWAERPCVLRYRAYCDRLRLARVKLPEPCKVVFFLPMPKSWGKGKRALMLGRLHKQRPDVDNLLKGLLDALYGDDSHVASIWAEKRWAHDGAIMVYPLAPAEAVQLAEA